MSARDRYTDSACQSCAVELSKKLMFQPAAAPANWPRCRRKRQGKGNATSQENAYLAALGFSEGTAGSPRCRAPAGDSITRGVTDAALLPRPHKLAVAPRVAGR